MSFRKKKDGSLKLRVDYRAVILKTNKDVYQLTRVNEYIDERGILRISTKIAEVYFLR